MGHADRHALVAFHNATGGASWRHKENWDTDADLSQWHGIEVNGQGRVVALSLPLNNLRGIVTCCSVKACWHAMCLTSHNHSMAENGLGIKLQILQQSTTFSSLLSRVLHAVSA